MIRSLYRDLNLKNKLSLILILSILMVVGILGIYFEYFLSKKYVERSREQMSAIFHRFELDLLLIQQELRTGIFFVQDDESMLASIDLINTYQNKNNYNASLLDEEKKRVAEQLLYRVKLSLNDDIALYDRHQELIAYVVKTPVGYLLSFISYENAKPILYSRYENESEFQRKPFLAHWLIPYKHIFYYAKNISQGLITYHAANDELLVKSHQNISDKQNHQLMGHIEMSHYIGTSYFKAFSKDLNVNIFGSMDPFYQSTSHLLYKPKNHQVKVVHYNEKYVSSAKINTNNGAYYVVSALDESFLSQTLNENRKTFFFIIIGIGLVALIFLRFLLNRVFAVPLRSLMVQIHKIDRQDYADSVIVRTGDELEIISKNIVQLARTIDERERSLIKSQQQLEDLSNTDLLTNLPNRRLFNAHLEHAFELARRNKGKIAVIFLDLDEFKEINDTLGHDIGDELLQKVALRLKASLRASDTLARIGGDEFNILIEGVTEKVEIVQIAQKIINVFRAPFICHENEIHTTASIGIAFFPEDGEDTVTLIKHADLAMYKSKNAGRNAYSFFSKDLSEYMEERTQCIHALKAAIDSQNEFYLLYQPKVTTMGKIVAIEALIRWKSPTLGMVYPDRFIPIAEESGLIIPIGEWVLLQACRDFMQLLQEGYELEHISINVSSIQLQKSDMIETLKETFEKTGINPHRLELEITESYIATEQEKGLSALQSLRNMGIRLAIDDFGTGYSSMRYLQKLPVTRLKIDKSFVDDLPDSVESAGVVRAIMTLAKTFNLALTAEGVETEEQLIFLREEQCDEIQGYYYSKPLELEALKQFYRQHY
jgi:diguanylate cyclase (GGDEF)-like protein